jgi:predicted short-subunit dehydrogenase-like oxidoreductase (DUF2520 family)
LVEIPITFIGAGNVAWHLAQALDAAGHIVQEVYSRKLESASKLASNLYNATPTQSTDFTGSKARVFIISIPDDTVESISLQLQLPPHAILVHTSGTLPLDALTAHKSIGVFYPLQTFSKYRELEIQQVPFCIEANNEDTEEVLVNLAQSISNTVYLVSSAERKVLHIAAVFACNFTNHLLAISHQIMKKEGLEFSLLKPLIEETINKALGSQIPASVQTGPAIRKDMKTMQSHLEFLKNYPTELQIYKIISDSIDKMGFKINS